MQRFSSKDHRLAPARTCLVSGVLPTSISTHKQVDFAAAAIPVQDPALGGHCTHLAQLPCSSDHPAGDSVSSSHATEPQAGYEGQGHRL